MMNENDLYKSISAKELPVYFLYGDERYSIEKAIRFAKETLDPNFRDLNFTIIDSDDETDIDLMVNCCESIPFMDDKRVIVVKNSDLFQTEKKGYGKKDIEKVIQYLEMPCKTTVVMFTPPEVDKQSKLYKYIRKKYDFYQSDRLDKVRFSSWVSEQFKEYGVEIDKSVIEYFIHKSGYLFRDSEITLLDVESEIQKICMNVTKGNKVTLEDIDRISSPVKENDIFKFIDYIFTGDNKNAYSMLQNILNSEKNPLSILSLLGRQIAILLKVSVLKKEKLGQDGIAKILELHPFVVKKANMQLKNYSYQELLDLYNLCSGMDYRVKRGQIKDRISVEVMVGKICKNRQENY